MDWQKSNKWNIEDKANQNRQKDRKEILGELGKQKIRRTKWPVIQKTSPMFQWTNLISIMAKTRIRQGKDKYRVTKIISPTCTEVKHWYTKRKKCSLHFTNMNESGNTLFIYSRVSQNKTKSDWIKTMIIVFFFKLKNKYY